MNKKNQYMKPSVEVVVLNQESLLNSVSGEQVNATMNTTWTEEDI